MTTKTGFPNWENTYSPYAPSPSVSTKSHPSTNGSKAISFVKLIVLYIHISKGYWNNKNNFWIKP